MYARSKYLLLSSLLLACSVASASDRSAELRDRLKAAAALSALDDPTLKPWHWQLDVTVYGRDGKNPSSGSLEMWFSGSNMVMRYSLASEQMTVLRVGGRLFRTPGEMKRLASAVSLQLQLMHPVPNEVFASTVSEQARRQKVGSGYVELIMPTLVKQTNATISSDPPFAFVLQTGGPRLLMTYAQGGRVLRRSLGMFQEREVPTELAVYGDRTLAEEAKTVKLEATTVGPDVFQVRPEMIPLEEPVQITSGHVSSMLLGERLPEYPVDARLRHVQGNIVFDAVIGRDGHVQSVQLVGTADPSLVQEADRTIRSWIYRPFLVNGIPVEVNTQIHMNFTFG